MIIVIMCCRVDRCNIRAEYRHNTELYCKKHAFGKCLVQNCRNISRGNSSLCKKHSFKLRSINQTVEHLKRYCRHPECYETTNTIYGLCYKHKYCNDIECYNIVSILHDYCKNHRQRICIIDNCNEIAVNTMSSYEGGITCYYHSPDITGTPYTAGTPDITGMSTKPKIYTGIPRIHAGISYMQ
jgi:hypothetical protein